MSIRPRRRRPRLAFSLIEFTAVLALMAILAGIVSVSVHHLLIKGKQDAAKAQIANLRSAVETYFVDTGHYPTNDEGLAVLTQKSAKVSEPLLPQLPADPWGNPYEYLCPGPSQPFAIVCLGADGREGGTGADSDISSENLQAGPAK